MSKSILCFGDSLTWGFNPETRSRYEYEVRWTGVLAGLLGPEFRVIEEGLNARTTGFDDPVEWDRNGRRQFPAILQTHTPVDLVVILLGVNDLKPRLRLSGVDIASSAAKLVDMARTLAYAPAGGPPKVLLVCPPPLGNLKGTSLVFQGAEATSRELAIHYQAVATSRGCHFLDAGAHLQASEVDGVHWDPEANRQFSEALAPVVRSILGN
jgi:lysophospholipase L1-like esterase